MNIEQTYTATIFIAGNIDTAKHWLMRYCYNQGFCVTVTPTIFIYTGAEEAGMAIGLINYPRFPSTPDAIFSKAVEITRSLILELCQKSATVVASDKSMFIQIDPPGRKTTNIQKNE